MSARTLHQNADPRMLPAYGIGEAAHYLNIAPSTLRSWVLGRPYPTMQGQAQFKPPIAIADPERRLLSFVNLVEAHVLSAIRREHEVALKSVRQACDFLRRQFNSTHPLATQKFETDGRDLFVTRLGQLINASQEGQLAMRALLELHLRRVEWDAQGLAVRLYPFTRRVTEEGSPDPPRLIVIDPGFGFGRPVLSGTGIVTSVIAERYKAGESIEELAHDYGRQGLEIEEAIRCELYAEAA